MSGSSPIAQPSAAAATAFVDNLDERTNSMMSVIFSDIVRLKKKDEQRPVLKWFSVFVVRQHENYQFLTTPLSWEFMSTCKTPSATSTEVKKADFIKMYTPAFGNFGHLLRAFRDLVRAGLAKEVNDCSTPHRSNRTNRRRLPSISEHPSSNKTSDVSSSESESSNGDASSMDIDTASKSSGISRIGDRLANMTIQVTGDDDDSVLSALTHFGSSEDDSQNPSNLMVLAKFPKEKLKPITDEISQFVVYKALIVGSDEERELPSCDTLPCSGSSALMVMASWIKKYLGNTRIPSHNELVRDINRAVGEDLESIDLLVSTMKEELRLIRERGHVYISMSEQCEIEIFELLKIHSMNGSEESITILRSIRGNLRNYMDLFRMSAIERENHPRIYHDFQSPRLSTERVRLQADYLRERAITILRDIRSLADRVNNLKAFLDGEVKELKKVLQAGGHFCHSLETCPGSSELRMEIFFPTDQTLSEKLRTMVDSLVH